MLSRKYYRIIAQCIKDNKIYSNNSTRKILKMDSLVDDLCVEFKKDNMLFNRDKFVEHCE